MEQKFLYLSNLKLNFLEINFQNNSHNKNARIDMEHPKSVRANKIAGSTSLLSPRSIDFSFSLFTFNSFAHFASNPNSVTRFSKSIYLFRNGEFSLNNNV